QINDSFWTPRLKMNAEEAIFYQWEQLEKTRCIDNFRLLAGQKESFREGFFFSDSDAYKWLDAASRIYTTHPSADLNALINEFIKLIQRIHDKGYLFTYNQIHFPSKRWVNLWIEHELYCLGHLIEAAVSHYNIEKNPTLLEIAEQSAQLLLKRFMYAKSADIPGHQEIEIALIKLYRMTNNMDYLKLAEAFLNRRGTSRLVWWKFLRNAKSTARRMQYVGKLKKKYLQDHPDENNFQLPASVHSKLPPGIRWRSFFNFATGKYLQNHLPITKQFIPEGHSVRFSYLETAIAMLASETGDKDKYLPSLEAAWNHMVQKRMFITGGIGSLPLIEGFGKDYELDPEYAYAETCAALGCMFWDWEMTLLTRDAKYADLFEWQLYNAASVGIALDGKSYLYRNPLTSRGNLTRREWYKVPCCPSNLSRTWSALGSYIYSYDDKEIWIHQYIGSKSEIPLEQPVKVEMTSGFPWEGNVKIRIKSITSQEFGLNLRIPSWADTYSIKINDEEQLFPPSKTENEQSTASGYSPYKSHYVSLTRNWAASDMIEINFPIDIRVIQSHPKVHTSLGNAVITRGPIVYCLESLDNPQLNIFNVEVIPSSLRARFSEDHFNGIWIVEGENSDGSRFLAIPYFCWANRGQSEMNVMLYMKST
ncbi:MAG: glycoside hydrolase family 127 protein, partial [Promethearchaeota archaeon]